MDVRARLAQIALVFALAAAGVAWRLWRLQVVEHDFWEEAAVRARTRAVALPFRRGSILDTRGRPIATTRTTWDLDLVFAHLRRGSATGQLLLAHYLMTGERLASAALFADPERTIAEFAQLTVGELRRIEPGARREDLLTYAAWLVDAPNTREFVERLRREDEAAPCCPPLAERAGEILARVRAEQSALGELERALALKPGELVRRIDAAIRAIDARVTKLLGRRDRAGKLYECERELHKELDYRKTTLVRNVPLPTVFGLAADPGRLPGLVVTEESRRLNPPENDGCWQIVGRVGLPTKEDLDPAVEWSDERSELSLEAWPTIEQLQRMQQLDEWLRCDGIGPDEEVGHEGLEGSFEPLLRGRRGWRRTENDRFGNEERVVEVVDPVAGLDLRLTLDVELQKAAEAALARGVVADRGGPRRRYAGAFVLLELPEMKVRVLASSPAPSRADVSEHYRELADDAVARPLHPRAWRPWLPPPPGSSIKPIVAALALSAGVIGPGTEFQCTKDQLFAPGEKRPIKCEGLHGSTTLHTAIVKSCNHYFAHVAAAAGSKQMIEWFRALGFGECSGFTGARLADGRTILPLAEEVAGTARREPGGRNLMLLGMGQGMIDVTPLQMAAAIGALALRCTLPPTLIERVGDEAPLRPAPVALPISDAAWNVVVAAMRDVTRDGGTADPDHGADLTPYDLATKTGTPQQGKPTDPDHSWFVGFFPSRAPRYAFAIFLERTGRHGGDVAAPILLELLNDPAFAEIAAAARNPAPRPAAEGGP